MEDRRTFIENWILEKDLGEGSYSEVKLLVNKKTKDQVALKVINLELHSEAEESVRKEIQIHKVLDHENIIRFYGSRREGPVEYLFLEYASNGELFDRIEPDYGIMETGRAQAIFQQLINGVDYLHTLGIAHRDLKPENILFDKNEVLKISDFGFATPFRIRGKERLLEKRCGTLPYVSPEVLKGKYKATPADIWSCGIILVALLAGELPWDKPDSECVEYERWKQGNISGNLWNKLDIKALNFVKRLLYPMPSKRITMSEIQKHPWLNKKSSFLVKKRMGAGSPLAKKVAGLQLNDREDSRLCLSQPEQRIGEPIEDNNYFDAQDDRCLNFSFSQPIGGDDFFVGSQLGSGTPNSSPGARRSRWVKRMTRFCVATPVDETIKELLSILEDFGFNCKSHFSSVPCITISTVDKRKNILVFKAYVIEMGNRVLLEFRLSRGDGLEFKRIFVKLRDQFKVEFKGPSYWLL